MCTVGFCHPNSKLLFYIRAERIEPAVGAEGLEVSDEGLGIAEQVLSLSFRVRSGRLCLGCV